MKLISFFVSFSRYFLSLWSILGLIYAGWIKMIGVWFISIYYVLYFIFARIFLLNNMMRTWSVICCVGLLIVYLSFINLFSRAVFCFGFAFHMVALIFCLIFKNTFCLEMLWSIGSSCIWGKLWWKSHALVVEVRESRYKCWFPIDYRFSKIFDLFAFLNWNISTGTDCSGSVCSKHIICDFFRHSLFHFHRKTSSSCFLQFKETVISYLFASWTTLQVEQ